MSTSINTATALVIIKSLGNGARFYASDFGFAGGTVHGLDVNGYIRKTGNTKKYMVNIYDNHFIEAEVYEWEVFDRYEIDTEYPTRWKEYYKERRIAEFKENAEKIITAAKILKKMGYEF